MRQETVFDLLFTSTLSLHKADGRVFDNIRAQVSRDRIIIAGDTLPVEVGDKLTQVLPNGLPDEYVINDFTYQPAIAGLPARFHLSVHRASSGHSWSSKFGPNKLSDGVPDLQQASSASLAPPPKADGPAMGKPGPQPNLKLALRVLGIVERIAGVGPWKDRLDEICDALDEAHIPTPKTWKKREIETWADAAALERELAKKAIEHHLELARG